MPVLYGVEIPNRVVQTRVIFPVIRYGTLHPNSRVPAALNLSMKWRDTECTQMAETLLTKKSLTFTVRVPLICLTIYTTAIMKILKDTH